MTGSLPGEAAFRTLVEKSFDGVLVIDGDGVVRYANPAAVGLLRAGAGDLVGRQIGVPAIDQAVELIVPGGEGERHVEMRAEAIVWDGAPGSMAALRDVTDRWRAEVTLKAALEERERLLREADRVRVAQLSVLEDQKLAQDSLRASEERFRTIFEQAPLGVALIDSHDARILEVNPKFAQIAGRSREELVTIDWKSITHPDDVQADLDNMARMNAGEIPGFNMRKRYLKPDGSVVWINMTIAPVRLSGDRPRHLCMIEDVTEREFLQRRMAEEQEKFRAIVDQAIAGIYTFDGGRVTYMNPRAAAIFGYTQGEVIGMSAMDFIAPEDRALVQENIRRRIEDGVSSLQYEFRGQRKDGSTVLIGVHGSVTVLEGRRIILGVLQDITDKRRTEETIQLYVKRLESAVLGTAAAVSQMVELRDPYTAGHERRVGELSAAIAAELGLDEDLQRGLRVAGAVHDVGKILVPAEILSKPAKLSALEFEMVKQHAAQGYEVLKAVEFPWPVAEVARQHHERMDGSGYPRGLKGAEILLEARILAVADVVESMASHRPYRPGLGIEAALGEIEKNAGRLYDPEVAAACLRLFRERGYRIPA